MSYIIAIGAYLFLLMIYGLVIAHKKVKTADDMVTGGHRIPFIILVGSLLATWCGGGGITGNASIIYNGGPWVGAITFAAPPIGIILLYFIAGKVRKSNKVTVPEIMGARYGQSASIISAVCVMLAYVGVLATQLKAAADILVLLCSSSGVEISRGLALVICTTIIVVITVGGGLVSVAYSDAISALIMCACMAFIVTTADSYLLSSATNLTNDIYVKYIRKDATDKQKMLVLRGTIVVFSVIAVALTLYFPTVLSLQMTAYTMYGAAITPAILFALFSKKVTPAAGIAGILVGGLATIVWTLMGTPYGIQCAIVAVPASVIAILVVSAVTPKGEAARSLDALYQEK